MIVADVNLVAYLLIPGPFTALAETAFIRDRQWTAPAIWQHEMLNILSTTVRRGDLQAPLAMPAYREALALIEPAAAEPNPLAVFDLSVASQIATYDCQYVVLARELGLRVVTADQQMQRAFRDVVVSLQDFAAGK